MIKSLTARHFRWYDWVIMHIAPIAPTTRERPDANVEESQLNKQEKKHCAGLMRINHVGEVCAQALYLGQSMTTHNRQLRAHFIHAAQEEADHLYWCEQRLSELAAHKSYLNPLWFTGSLIIGSCAGLMGDNWSLGFVVETERQVVAHLAQHLEKLPQKDQKSRSIIMQMQQDEAKHATSAMNLGASELPAPIKITMRAISKVMTTFAYYI